MRRLLQEDRDTMARAGRSDIAFAKTTRPTLGSVVDRQPLFARLDSPAGRTVVWISGPPGAGKTTLAASYVQARRLQSVWYQLDPDDDDPATFFHYLCHAARKLKTAAELPAFTPQHADDIASFARKFFRQFFAGVRGPLALVLDNLHVIAPDSELHVALEAGLSQVPKESCVIVTSRGEPAASLARMRAAGQVCCVNGEDLRVEPEEIVAIAARRGQAVSPDAAVKLFERTQGWAAGLVLMLEHSKFSGRMADLPGETTPQVIFDYLAGEIFEHFEAETREFLLRVACLPRMTAEVAAALSREPKAERILINLARNDYFVRDVSGDTGRVYQMHPLLREFLRKRAVRTLPEAVGIAWLQRAALLLHEAGHIEDAVALLMETKAWDEAARIVLAAGDALLAQGRSATLAAWLDILPLEVVAATPGLLRLSALARAHASPRAARQLFERAFEGFRGTNDSAGMSRCCCGIIDAIVLEYDDVTAVDPWLDTLDGLLKAGDHASSAPIDSAAVATLLRGTLLRDPGNTRVEFWLGRTQPTPPDCIGRGGGAAKDELELAQAMAILARGDLAAAGSVVDGLRARGAELAVGTRLALAIVGALNNLAGGAYAEATRLAQEALATAGAEGIHAYDTWLRVIAVAVSLSAGDRAAAQRDLELLEGEGARLRRADRASIHFLRSWSAALEGDVVRAHRDAKSALAVAIETGIPWLECLARISLAQLPATGNDRRGVEAQLRAAEALAERSRSPWLRFGAQLAAGTAARNVGDTQTALDAIGAAFRSGHEQGFRPPPGSHAQALAELCATALDAQVEPDFARMLVREGRLMPRAPPLRVRGWPWPIRIVTCGNFQCMRNDVPIELSGKGPGRVMELLKVLVAFGCHNVRTEKLADALWPHVEADFAYKSFTATLHRLRRLLVDEDALALSDGRLTLNKGFVWVDTWALGQLFDDFDAAPREPDGDGGVAMRQKFTEDLLALYRAPFLSDESEQPAYIACREQLRARSLRFLAHVTRGHEQAGAPDKAVDCYLRFIEADALYEPLYRQLMQWYQRTGATIEALATYERLRTILATQLKIMPSAETQALYASLRTA